MEYCSHILLSCANFNLLITNVAKTDLMVLIWFQNVLYNNHYEMGGSEYNMLLIRLSNYISILGHTGQRDKGRKEDRVHVFGFWLLFGLTMRVLGSKALLLVNLNHNSSNIKLSKNLKIQSDISNQPFKNKTFIKHFKSNNS